MASVRLESIAKVYAGGHAALRAFSLAVADGELVTLVGPSGSGKSTVLRIVAGLEQPSGGRILIGDRDVTDEPPERRDVAMVFQNYALYPHKTVRDNLAFGLRMRGVAPAEVRARVQRAAATLGLADLLDRRPAQLSGGQRQRVALGRAIVRSPLAFLLDEPLSNLDPLLRASTRAELALLHRSLGATMLYVTHDQEEAMTLGGRVAVMRDGRLEQIGAPLDLYHRPANVFVATFVGTPAMNVWRSPAGDDTLVGVRPHDVERAVPDGADAAGLVTIVEPLGATAVVHLQVPSMAERLRMVVPSPETPAIGDEIPVRFRRDRIHYFDARTGAARTD